MASSTTAFSSDGVEVISRRIESRFPSVVYHVRNDERDKRKYYELERCISFIKTHNFHKVKMFGEDLC